MVTLICDIHAEDLKAKIRKRFGSIQKLERLYRIPANSAVAALRRPHRRAETAIAKALGERPERIWPSRYDDCGRRLSPQPSENYRSARGSKVGAA